MLIVNGKYLAAPSCKACRNSDYLMAVFKLICWTPDFKDVKKANCLFPPKKQKILDEVIKEINKKPDPENFNLGYNDASAFDKEYLLDVLCTLNEDHPFFAKGYRPEQAEVR